MVPNQIYTGFSEDFRQRLVDHNDGKNRFTSADRPWQLTELFCFTSKHKALSFERYLKSGSGRAFSKRHL
jgi:putative endonuclease